MDILFDVFRYVGDNPWTSVSAERAAVLEFTLCARYWNLVWGSDKLPIYKFVVLSKGKLE